MKAKSSFINAQGRNVRIMQYEVPQTFYDITKDPNKESKPILQEVVNELVDRPSSDYTFEFITAHIAYRMVEGGKHRMYAPNDTITIPKGTFKNSQPIQSTIGRLIFYKIMVEDLGLQSFISYEEINKPFTKKDTNAFESKVSMLLVEDKIDTDRFADYINHRDWLGLQLHGAVTVSFTEKTTKTPPKVKALRDELFEKYDKELKAGDIITANKIENELIDAMFNEIKDDPGYDLYASGARGTPQNHMKNMWLMRGGVLNPNTGKYDIMKTSFTDGLRKEDFTPASNSIVIGAYAKTVSTADSGYLAKQLMNAMQGEVIGDAYTDCGTKETLECIIDNPSDFLNRFIDTGGDKLQLTNEIIGKYKGKTVKMYSPMYCRKLKNGCICEKCAGVQTSKFAGLDTNKLATTLTNLNMKKFHVTNIEFYNLKPSELFVVTDGSAYTALKDGKLIVTKPFDILVQQSHYDSSLVEELGSYMRLFGTVSVRLGSNKYDTLNVPSWHNYNVFSSDSETVDLPGIGSTKCRVFHYEVGHELCNAMVVRDSENAQSYLTQIIYGKIPGTIPYDKSLALWNKNQEINSVNFGVASLTLEVVLSCSYRFRKDPTIPFGRAYANGLTKDKYEYEMASFRRICQLSSTFAGITAESFDDMVTSATNKSRTHAEETYSPLEMLLKL
jgi:hypothetical protein